MIFQKEHNYTLHYILLQAVVNRGISVNLEITVITQILMIDRHEPKCNHENMASISYKSFLFIENIFLGINTCMVNEYINL